MTKKPERPSFESVYMDFAKAIANRSSCKRLNVGTVITSTDFRKVLAVGVKRAEEPGCAGHFDTVCRWAYRLQRQRGRSAEWL